MKYILNLLIVMMVLAGCTRRPGEYASIKRPDHSVLHKSTDELNKDEKETQAHAEDEKEIQRWAEAEKEALTRAEAEKAAELKKAHDAVAAQYMALVKKLNSMECTKADVDAIDKFASAHKDEISDVISANSNKVTAYRKFFDKDQAIVPLTRYFTIDQQNACKYYNKYWDIHKKNDGNRNFRYAAEKAKEMGIL